MVIEISMAYDYDIFITTITMEITVQGSARCSSALGLFDHCVDCVDTYLYKGGGLTQQTISHRPYLDSLIKMSKLCYQLETTANRKSVKKT